MTFLQLCERIEKLAGRLPAPLRKPILEEVTPLKNLFLRRRPPRIVILGESGAGSAHLINAIFNAEVAEAAHVMDPAAHSEPPSGTAPAILNEPDIAGSSVGWRTYSRASRGTITVLDARRPAALDGIQAALAQEAPDIFLFLRATAEIDDAMAADLTHAAQVLGFAERRHHMRPGLVGLLMKHDHAGEVESVRNRLHACLLTQHVISERLVTTLAISPFVRFRLNGSIDVDRDERENIDQLAEVITRELPDEAKLEMARLCGVRSAQAHIAQILLRSTTAICSAIGTQPIPLADFPILTSIQATMVAGIIYISGREMSAKLAAEFIAALGTNIGAGLVLREGSRAALKLLPGWGNAVSGAIAGAGTYAIGRAAIACFIEGVSIPDARKLFRRRGRRSLQ